MSALGRCVSCATGNHAECDAFGSPGGSFPCTCCPDAATKSPARRLADALRTTTTNQGGDLMVTKKAAPAAKKAPAKAATKKAPAKAAAPKAEPKQAVNDDKHATCPLCGCPFKAPRVGTCRSESACKRRQSDPTYRVPGAQREAGAAKASATTKKVSTITTMNAERAALKAWKADGEKGPKPETPLIDKIQAEYAAKEAAAAAQRAARTDAKREVTPIQKAS